MKQNVGDADAAMRLLAGPSLLGLGLYQRGRAGGKLAMAAGAALTATAFTRVCPINALFGRDTSRREPRRLTYTAPGGAEAQADLERSKGWPAAAEPRRGPQLTGAPD